MRADALPDLKRHEALRQVFGANEGQYYLATLGGTALDAVITLPAGAADLVFGRGPDGKPFVSDGGHYIVDCAFGPIASPAKLESELNSIVGLVEHGLFLGMASEVIVAGREGVKVLLPR